MSDLKYGDKVKPTDIIHENKNLRGEILENQANYQLTRLSV
jgi:predicted RNA-binding protein